MSDTQIIQALTKVEQLLNNNPLAIQELEDEIERISGIKALRSRDFLIYRNHFRTKHAAHLRHRRPRLLVGMINYIGYPNFQILPLMEFGDVVSLAKPGTGQSRSDRLEFDVEYEDISQAISRLPKGFNPDYYWDVQVCGGGMHPLGLEQLPFPTVAGFCHLYRGVNVAAAGQLYDFLAPVSADFVPHFKRLFPNKQILSIPFGGNWGSFSIFDHDVNSERDIDLLVSFSETDRVEYGGYRNTAMKLAQEFKDKYGDSFNVVFLNGADKETYKRALHRTKIGLNVCAFNGPYNYRSCEIINSGALLLQMKIAFEGTTQSMENYFSPGEEFVEFEAHEMESVLLSLLHTPTNITNIAQAGQKRLKEAYSYEANHQKILAKVTSLTDDTLRSRRDNKDDSFQLWIRATYTAAPHHKNKRAVFAKLCAALDDFSSVEAIRYMLIGLPWLKQLFGAELSKVLTNETLKAYARHSLFSALEYLYFLIPAGQRTLFDTWTYECYKSRYESTDIGAIAGLSKEIDQSYKGRNLSLADIPPIPLDFDISTNEFDNARKTLIDMPFMAHAGDENSQAKAVLRYMQWWLNYFSEKAEKDAKETPLMSES